MIIMKYYCSDAAFEQDRLELVKHYETQIMGLQDELRSLRDDFEAERAAFQQLQSTDEAQAMRQEMQVSGHALLSDSVNFEMICSLGR